MPQQVIAGAALLQARDCIAGDVMTGRLDLHSRIDVHDEADAIVYSIRFEDALEIAPPR